MFVFSTSLAPLSCAEASMGMASAKANIKQNSCVSITRFIDEFGFMVLDDLGHGCGHRLFSVLFILSSRY